MTKKVKLIKTSIKESIKVIDFTILINLTIKSFNIIFITI